MSDTRDTLPTSGEEYPAGTSPNVYTTTPNGSTMPAGAAGSESTSSSGGGMETAKAEAANVAGTAKDEAAHVAHTAKQEAKHVGREARTQLSRLYDETRMELSDQAAHRQDRLARGLRSASEELNGMAASSSNGGVATDLVRQAASRLDGAATWLGDRDPGAVLDEVKRYARRRPVVFLGLAALAGVVVGRLTRSIAAGEPDSGQDYTARRGMYGSSGAAAPGATGLGHGAGTSGAYGTGTTGAYGTGTGTGAYGGEAATGAYDDSAVYGDTPVYDASSAGRLGTDTGSDVVGEGSVNDAVDGPNDPLYRPGEHG